MCKLCGAAAPLRNSHIIPRFVGKWMKSTSPTPYLKSTDDIDQRLQDLPTVKLLCGDCEERFSAWETKFANDIFHPYVKGKVILSYRSWLSKFAVSLTWRAIQHHHHRSSEDTSDLAPILSEMEGHLSRYLLGQEENVGQYTQHIYPLDILANPVKPGSPMLNRYFARAVQTDIIITDDFSEVLVYIKLPMFMLFAVGRSKQRKWLETSRIRKNSTLHPKRHVLDERLFGYFLEQSDLLFEASKARSIKSKDRVNRALQKALVEDPIGVSNSKWMEAFTRDYDFYGKDALLPWD